MNLNVIIVTELPAQLQTLVFRIIEWMIPTAGCLFWSSAGCFCAGCLDERTVYLFVDILINGEKDRQTGRQRWLEGSDLCTAQ